MVEVIIVCVIDVRVVDRVPASSQLKGESIWCFGAAKTRDKCAGLG